MIAGVLGVVLGVVVLVVSGLVALGLTRKPQVAGAVAASGVVLGALLGLWPTVRVLAGGASSEASASWSLPGGTLAVGLDPLSAFFLVPMLVLGAVAAVYGREYLLLFADTRRLGFPFFGFNLLIASMVMVVLARNAVLFLVAWEIMAVAAALLVSFEHDRPEALRAGWVYLVVAHLGAMCLFVLFLLFKASAGSFDFAAFAQTPPVGSAAVAVAVLALVGFGSKAGFVPLHVWLPEAHAAAPSHVSAILSGVLLKVGFYGLLRVFQLLGTRADWWGPALVALGISSALVAIVVALYQRDFKRALAYSSIENVGVIAVGLGVSFWAGSRGHPRVSALALAGALMHVWNHAVMKGGMFLVAGSVLHGTGTRDLEQLGGLSRRMPVTAVAMTVGVLALSALPPLNGFVSEWLLYLSLLRLGADGAGPLPLLLVGMLALVAALAALAFVRLYGVVLLGQPRSDVARHAHESSRWMTVPMLVLAGLCVAMAVFPGFVLAALDGVRAQVGGPALFPADQLSLGRLGAFNLALWAVVLLGGRLFLGLVVRRPVTEDDTWACGYPEPTARMQYGARSFSELASEQVLPAMLGPRVTRVKPVGLFPGAARFSADDRDPLTRRWYEPAFARVAGWLASLAWVQRGVLTAYLTYVFAAVLAALLWVSLRSGGAP